MADILKKQAPANSTGEHDLDQRVIFFDEFQGLDTINPMSERKKFLEDMKKLFAVNKTDVVAAQNWLRQEKLQMKHPVLAIAINGETKDLQAIRQTQEGKALQSRLMSMVVPNSAHRLDLNPDISKHIPEFIDNFGKERYFENVNDVRFDGPIHLTHRAKEAFLQKFSEMAEYMGSTQGRTLADMMVADINQAITDAEGSRRFPFKRSNTANGSGLITDSLVVDANANGAFSVKTGNLSQTESESFLKQHQKGWRKGVTSLFTTPKVLEAPPAGAEPSTPPSGTVHTLSDSEDEEEANQQALVPYRPQSNAQRQAGFVSSLLGFQHSPPSESSFNHSINEGEDGLISRSSDSSFYAVDHRAAENQAVVPYLERFAQQVAHMPGSWEDSDVEEEEAPRPQTPPKRQKMPGGWDFD